MRKILIVLAALSMLLLTPVHSFGQTGSVLTLSEVMFNPSESNGEFIEIYNTSTTETVNLSGFKIKYYTSTADNLVAFIGGLDLQPGKYAVIIENDYDYNNGAYKNLIPADAIVLKIADASFGSSGMANTTSRDVSLLNASSLVVDTYTYSADNNAGISDEKYLLNKDNSSTNWRNGTTANGTPGKINSVTPISYLFNLTARLSSLTPANPVERDSVAVKFIVKNNGVLDAANYSVEVFRDANADSIEQVSERIFSRSYIDLSSNDSIFVETKFYADQVGQNLLIAKVTYTPDEKVSDNKAYVLVNIAEKPASYTDVVINEIMYAPANDEPEWIELYNRTDHTVNLKNWKVTDNSLTATITTSDFLLQPYEYVVVSSDATISSYYTNTLNLIVKALPSFSNSGDDVILKSSANSTVDSVKYSPTWGGNTGGKSLERVSFDVSSTEAANWKTSVSKYRATPSKINSISSKNHDLSVKSFSTTAKYAEIGKTIQLKAVIENLGKNTEASYSVKLFRDVNLNNLMDDDEKLDEIAAANITSLATADFNFTVGSFVAGQNQFLVRVDLVTDEFTENNIYLYKINAVQLNELPGDLVVNEIMYSPNSSDPEWIEIYNKSSKQINLNGYQLANSTSKNKVVSKSVILNPEEFFVITRDSSIYQTYPKLSKFAMATFPTLTNTKDKVVILDSLDRTIDSLEYKNVWGGAAGKSLERLDWVRSSTDSTNWKTSINELGGTPGTVNSNSQKKFDIAVSKIIYTPAAPLVGQKVKISVGVTNIGKNDAAFKFVLNRVNKDGSKQKVEESNTITLFKNASLNYEFTFAVEVLASKQTFEAVASFALDEDQTNNSVVASVRPGYLAGTVLLNEVMYNPLNGEPEWIELYNASSFDVDLEDWSITDVLTTPQKLKIQAKDFIFPSKTYLVVAKDSTVKAFHKTIGGRLIISAFANLNNDADGVVIKDSRDVTIDSLLYDKTWGTEAGKSLERIVFENSTNDKSNWGFSKDIELSTPGKNNSVSPKDHDIAITKIIFTPYVPVIGERVKISVGATNVGKNDAAFKFVLNRVSSDGSKLKVEESNSIAIVKGASLSYEFTFAIDNITSKQSFEAVVDYAADEDLTNNTITNFVRPGYTAGTVLLNEVMYNPLNGEPEWIELYNNSAFNIDLEEWSITDVLTTPAKTKITAKEFSFPSKTYLVIVKDSTLLDFHKTINGKLIVSSFSNLNNEADGVVIKDSRDATVDSISFDKTWGGENGKSLERILLENATNVKANWASSKDIELSTPGKINTVSPKEYDLEVTSITSAQKYGIIGKKVKFSIDVKNIGKNNAAAFSVKLFRDGNKNGLGEPSELVYLKNEINLAAGISSKYDVEDGSYSNGTNNYMAVVEFAEDQYADNNQSLLKINCVIVNEERNDLVINEVMHSPIVGEPEWIEIYNNSAKQINLKGYQVGNGASKSKVIAQDVVLKPEEYFIVAKDSAVYTRFTNIGKSVVSAFPTLSNTRDRVVLLDSLDRTIDSLEYKSSWGGTSGKSLERLDWIKLSTDSTNWKTSFHELGATPGFINSISQKKFDVALTKLSYNPTVPIAGQRVMISASATNKGKNDAAFKFILYRINKDSSKQKVEETNTLVISKDASLTYDFTFAIENILTKQTYEAVVDFGADEDLTNNSSSASVRPGYSTGTVYINEVMY
ncbi:MAG: lamin tail domain-containing protein, partial [Ignavibacteria bacterium]|nr:lamin tail domain-containing protein [Ignavibacteria bacterium]